MNACGCCNQQITRKLLSHLYLHAMTKFTIGQAVKCERSKWTVIGVYIGPTGETMYTLLPHGGPSHSPLSTMESRIEVWPRATTTATGLRYDIGTRVEFNDEAWLVAELDSSAEPYGLVDPDGSASIIWVRADQISELPPLAFHLGEVVRCGTSGILGTIISVCCNGSPYYVETLDKRRTQTFMPANQVFKPTDTELATAAAVIGNVAAAAAAAEAAVVANRSTYYHNMPWSAVMAAVAKRDHPDAPTEVFIATSDGSIFVNVGHVNNEAKYGKRGKPLDYKYKLTHYCV